MAVNTKALLKRLYSLARHPNPYRRLGSALAFQQFYRIFRNEPNLVRVAANFTRMIVPIDCLSFTDRRICAGGPA